MWEKGIETGRKMEKRNLSYGKTRRARILEGERRGKVKWRRRM